MHLTTFTGCQTSLISNVWRELTTITLSPCYSLEETLVEPYILCVSNDAWRMLESWAFNFHFVLESLMIKRQIKASSSNHLLPMRRSQYSNGWSLISPLLVKCLLCEWKLQLVASIECANFQALGMLQTPLYISFHGESSWIHLSYFFEFVHFLCVVVCNNAFFFGNILWPRI
jgi:hypothetical protein